MCNHKSVFVTHHQARDESNVHSEGLHWDIQKHKHQFDECNQNNESLKSQEKLCKEQQADLNKLNGIDAEECSRLSVAETSAHSESVRLTGEADNLDATCKNHH